MYKNEKPALYQTTQNRLIAARQRRLAREQKGTDEEYVRCIVEEYKIFNPIREIQEIVGD